MGPFFLPFLDHLALRSAYPPFHLHQRPPSPRCPPGVTLLSLIIRDPCPQSEAVPNAPTWVPQVPGLGVCPCRLGDLLTADANVSHAEFQAGQAGPEQGPGGYRGPTFAPRPALVSPASPLSSQALLPLPRASDSLWAFPCHRMGPEALQAPGWMYFWGS